MNIEAEVAQRLLQIKAIKLSPQNPFTWASGILSPIYCDNRVVLSYPESRTFIKNCLVEKSKSFAPFTMVAGVATAGIPHAALLADALGLPMCYVRDKAKGHGRQNLIEGEVRGNERVLVIEDLISTGGSSIKAVEALQNHGLTVIGTLAIFSYGFDEATEVFKAADCPLLTLSNYDALLQQAVDIEYIKNDDLELLKAWRKNPKTWGI
jgi:orotate phosphoribosyltransferase